MQHVLSFLFLAAYSVQAEAAEVLIPVQAAYSHRLYQVTSTGERELVQEHRGVFLRATDGSEIKRFVISETGKTTARQLGLLRDMKSRKLYRLEYGPKKAVMQQEIPENVSIRLGCGYFGTTGKRRRISELSAG